MEKRLITSALPYVNNIPHLGNLIQVLSADVFARFSRSRGYHTRYICGTDEYGTATETKAREEKVDPETLCNRYFIIHKDIYDWFDISFDHFGRTSDPVHTEITQQIFLRLYEQGYVKSKKTVQLYSSESKMFLADRFVRGRCPKCDYPEARGDQCENCGTLLDPMDLIDPRSIIDNSVPAPRETEHLYVDLPGLCHVLEPWVMQQSEEGHWAKNAVTMTKAWIRDGLKERAITRDLKWGIPVPLDGYRNKVFYVWFDAPIGYISITASKFDDWQQWWQDDTVRLFQFVGKDNIPFHSVIFPAVLMGTGEKWNLVHHISSSEYLNYEGGSFSKSRNFGVFGDQIQATGIPSDMWRFYLMYHRPETSDYNFNWEGFQHTINTELIGNFSNLVHRILSFCRQHFPGPLPPSDQKNSFWDPVRQHQTRITDLMEGARQSAALKEIMLLCAYANRSFQNAEPWKLRTTDSDTVKVLLSNLVHLIHDIAILITPVIPQSAQKVFSLLGLSETPTWQDLGTQRSFSSLQKPRVLFQFLEDAHIQKLKQQYGGKRKDATEIFSQRVHLCAARIQEVQSHPHADRLYVLQLDDGGEGRQIVSGLVGHYTPEQLQGKTIILVENLKPTKLRKISSNGMLLAVQQDDRVEVLMLEEADPGAPVCIEGTEAQSEYTRISIDEFLKIPIISQGGKVTVSGKPLICMQQALTSAWEGPVS